MKIAVTGASGLLGSYLVFKLAQKGICVHALYRHETSLEWTFRIWKKIFGAEKDQPLITWIKGDILRDWDVLHTFLHDCEVLIHGASVSPSSKESTTYMYKNIVQGTQIILDLAQGNRNMKKIIGISCGSALIDKENSQKLEDKSDKESYFQKYKKRQALEFHRVYAEGMNASVVHLPFLLGYGNWHYGSCQVFRDLWYQNIPKVHDYFMIADVRDAADYIARLATDSEDSREHLTFTKACGVNFSQLLNLAQTMFTNHNSMTCGKSNCPQKIKYLLHYRNHFKTYENLLSRFIKNQDSDENFTHSDHDESLQYAREMLEFYLPLYREDFINFSRGI